MQTMLSSQKARIVWQLSSILLLSAATLPAQETNQIEQLRQQLQELQANFEKVVQQQRLQIQALQKQIETLQNERTATALPPLTPPAEQPPRPAESSLASPTPGADTSRKPWSPTEPITLVRSGTAYMNIGFTALLDFGWATTPEVSMLERGDHDPSQRGFSLPNAELALDGAVDPFFKGFANIALKLDNENQTEIELEEAYLLSSSLPANLQLKAGQFNAEFGRQNTQHPHAWAFVDQPLVLNRAFGPDGLRNVGARLSWLAPTPFYTELMLGVLNGRGGTAYSFRNRGADDGTGVMRFLGRAALDRELRGPGDLLYVPRLSSAFDLTDTQTLVVGASGAFGPNATGEHTRTQIYGLDAYWKWKSSRAQAGFPFVSWQTEVLYRRFEGAADPLARTPLPAETLEDWGLYSEVLWGFKPRWVVGLRGEQVGANAGASEGRDPTRTDRTRIAPNLTWYPSEFSKVRLQYNYDQDQSFGTEHSVWMQLEFLLGAHAAHKF